MFPQNAPTAPGPLPKDRSPERTCGQLQGFACTTSECRVLKVLSGHSNFGPNVVYYFFVERNYPKRKLKIWKIMKNKGFKKHSLAKKMFFVQNHFKKHSFVKKQILVQKKDFKKYYLSKNMIFVQKPLRKAFCWQKTYFVK